MMLLSSILLPGWIFWQAELPRAPVLFRVLIGRADNAPGANTRINSLCESLVLHESHGFAGKIRKAPPPSRQLNPTLFHPKDHYVTHPHPPRTASSSGRRDGAQDWPPPQPLPPPCLHQNAEPGPGNNPPPPLHPLFP